MVRYCHKSGRGMLLREIVSCTPYGKYEDTLGEKSNDESLNIAEGIHLELNQYKEDSF